MFPVNYILFLQIIIFLFITPGTPRIVIISHSMNYGVNKCIWTAFGDVSANIIQGSLVIFVLGSFFLDNPDFLNILKWVGIIYLFYLAYDVYKTKPRNLNEKNMTERSSFSFYRDGFVVAGTSPKAWAFFPLIFPQFIDFNSNYVIQFLILITTYVVLDFFSLIVYAIVANKLILWIKANPRVINTISACVLIIIAFIISFTQSFY
jgi:threonine/homoserine/homoserine lactone efflux protein